MVLGFSPGVAVPGVVPGFSPGVAVPGVVLGFSPGVVVPGVVPGFSPGVVVPGFSPGVAVSGVVLGFSPGVVVPGVVLGFSPDVAVPEWYLGSILVFCAWSGTWFLSWCCCAWSGPWVLSWRYCECPCSCHGCVTCSNRYARFIPAVKVPCPLVGCIFYVCLSTWARHYIACVFLIHCCWRCNVAW